MLTTMKKFILVLALGTLASSCSKKEDPTPQAPDQLLVRAWVLNVLESTDPDFQTSGQVLVGSEWTFNANNTFLLKASANGIEVSFPGTWSLSSDGKTLTVTSDYLGTPVDSSMKILALTSAQLILEESSDGMTNTYTFSAKS
jgi:hypothetical protein